MEYYIINSFAFLLGTCSLGLLVFLLSIEIRDRKSAKENLLKNV